MIDFITHLIYNKGMRYFIHPFIFLLLPLLLGQYSFATFAHAEEKQIPWYYAVTDDLFFTSREYKYYGSKYDDGNYFPKSRERELLLHIENNYLKKATTYQAMYENDNPLGYVSSIAMAKLFLFYEGNPFYIKDTNNSTPLMWIFGQVNIPDENTPDLTHQEIRNHIKDNNIIWSSVLPSNNAITIAKLYLGLGADIHAKTNESRTALTSSLYVYVEGADEWSDEPFDPKHRADDIIEPHDDRKPGQYDNDDYNDYTYYRSPVTYWLEEFMAKGLPVSMLDTHLMLYPHFMKTASVEEVTDMLNNPEAHKIPANINCPYRGADIESGFEPDPYSEATCPLIPFIHMRDAMGRTPLHIAGLAKNKAVYDFLISQGADITIKDFRDNLPILK
ncbi:MAG: ankyrin repeat domain-containing protein [Alphaproteobacteria bacterium]|nr:ankyrin repeat domain-containing protein [Alphaproteobacteria bacterium]